MKSALLLSLFAGVLLANTAPAAGSDHKPTFSASIADGVSTKEGAGTPLWNALKPVITAASKDGGAAFSKMLSPVAKAELLQGSARSRFTGKAVAMAMKSCLGPYLYDEGRDWVQFSWVCRVKTKTPLSDIMTFRESPELSVTAWYDGQLIKEIQAMEPLSVPGARRIAMGAAEMQVQR